MSYKHQQKSISSLPWPGMWKWGLLQFQQVTPALKSTVHMYHQSSKWGT